MNLSCPRSIQYSIYGEKEDRLNQSSSTQGAWLEEELLWIKLLGVRYSLGTKFKLKLFQFKIDNS